LYVAFSAIDGGKLTPHGGELACNVGQTAPDLGKITRDHRSSAPVEVFSTLLGRREPLVGNYGTPDGVSGER
jgi:hypothetical protein